jgi:hypothetical protein
VTATEVAQPAPVPETLAGDEPIPDLPEVLEGFREGPVLLAEENPLPLAVSVCPPRPGSGRRADETVFEGAWLSTLGISSAYLDDASGRLDACDAIYVDGEWQVCGHSSEGAAPAREVVELGGAPAQCGEHTSFVWVDPPDDAAWAMVSESGHWAAFPVGRLGLVRVVTNAGEVNVAYVDRRGRELGEETVPTHPDEVMVADLERYFERNASAAPWYGEIESFHVESGVVEVQTSVDLDEGSALEICGVIRGSDVADFTEGHTVRGPGGEPVVCPAQRRR